MCVRTVLYKLFGTPSILSASHDTLPTSISSTLKYFAEGKRNCLSESDLIYGKPVPFSGGAKTDRNNDWHATSYEEA